MFESVAIDEDMAVPCLEAVYACTFEWVAFVLLSLTTRP